MGNLCPADSAQAEKKDELDVFEVKIGDKVDAPEQRISGKVLKRTTTDVLVEQESGKKEWVDIEDLKRAEGPGVEDITAGMMVEDASQNIKGTVVKKTTTDVAIKKADGKVVWCDIEDVKIVK
mmetsp:Transcript_17702/g.30964  ORF Transcript_17702/g.30964 Transcript_17702/m.30964 type:complete len:123 (-) Transcript_17702:34-402(-)|eukprot:CAMPEP_0197652454 /NCGR_PEP_ID=MMETSP1338-20131121/34460_1 /TAXON_ID=43686 ORGANISM="Pelagodinium beii, Strain RCC1491" /NCGR_SAMPLE_ID=MMETSP1338 /ASSEMBLY_ACC=CAM_ASM_000754 /LENGTH=122 /DNA_ID=CAMNT_0043227331 /DNA_START=52 /DNA_END=420 /DNA_ORIENTATION=-